jgi:hypothetical protein
LISTEVKADIQDRAAPIRGHATESARLVAATARAQGQRHTNNRFRESFDQAHAAAGITEWPENALRHSFASYHLAHFMNAAETAPQLGHHATA